jgi:transcriptional regulator with XRE-family HTH domain
MNRIAERLRTARGSVPREEVAKAVGVSVSAMSMYENSDRIPRDEIKIRLAKYYGTTVQALFFDENAVVGNDSSMIALQEFESQPSA